MTVGVCGGDSTDSDDERGPGSLPDGFHQATYANTNNDKRR